MVYWYEVQPFVRLSSYLKYLSYCIIYNFDFYSLNIYIYAQFKMVKNYSSEKVGFHNVFKNQNVIEQISHNLWTYNELNY